MNFLLAGKNGPSSNPLERKDEIARPNPNQGSLNSFFQNISVSLKVLGDNIQKNACNIDPSKLNSIAVRQIPHNGSSPSILSSETPCPNQNLTPKIVEQTVQILPQAGDSEEKSSPYIPYILLSQKLEKLNLGFNNFDEFVESYGTTTRRNDTLQKIQDNPSIIDLMIFQLEGMNLNPKSKDDLFPLLNALRKFKTYPDPFKKEKNFLSTLVFLELKFPLPSSCTVSKSNSNLRKYKGLKYEKNRPMTIVINNQTGTVERLQIYHAEGASKIVKKVFDFTERKLKIVSRERWNDRRSDKANIEKKAERERRITEKCKDLPHVVQYLNGKIYSSRFAKKFLMTTSFCNSGDLQMFYENKSEFILTKKDKYKICSDVLEAVLNIHSLSIIHRDLKPGNIYLHRPIGEDGKYGDIEAYVGDFGLSCELEDKESITETCGSPYYMPPEKVLDEKNETPSGFSFDAWSLGIIFSELFYGTANYEKSEFAQSPEDVYRLSMKLEGEAEPKNRLSKGFLIHEMTRPKEEERISIQEGKDLFDKIYAQKFPKKLAS